jgi:carbon monoxide dehydrogenase subunit G
MTYNSEEVTLPKPAEEVFNTLSNLEGLRNLIAGIPSDKISDEQRQQLESVKVTADSISFPAGPVGDVTLRLKETVSPTLIRLEGVGTPVPLSITMDITPILPTQCKGKVTIDIQIPAMLKPMVSGPLQKMTDQFGQMLRNLPV